MVIETVSVVCEFLVQVQCIVSVCSEEKKSPYALHSISQKFSPTSLVFNPLRCKCFKFNWFGIKHIKVVLISVVQMSLINLFRVLFVWSFYCMILSYNDCCCYCTGKGFAFDSHEKMLLI